MTAIRILQLTDMHVFADAAATLKGIPTRETLRDVVEFIAERETAFDQVIITGDHTHDELPESYQSVREALRPWLDRVWQVPGNHDDREVLRSVFSDRVAGANLDRITFSFSCGDWTCLGLDSHIPGEVPGCLGDEQLEWLHATLASCDSPRIALFLHHPPVDVGSSWMDRIGLRDSAKLRNVISANAAIRLVCCGHVHHEFEARVGEAAILTTPSTGLQFDPRGDTPSFAAEAPGYRVIEFDGTEFSTRVVRLPEVRFIPNGE